MNAVEHIVDCYFRLCRQCFTMNDVKVVGGNNRQLDLLAINLLNGAQYHVESAVTHSWEWFTNSHELTQELNRKFFGIPAPKEGKNTDFTKGKTYTAQIHSMYQSLGLNPDVLQRVYVTWAIPEFANVEEAVVEYSRERNVRPIEVLSFRDTILPALEQQVGTSNYEDEVLRTLSLLRQRQLHVAQLPAAIPSDA